MLASSRGYPEIVQALLAKGADVNAKTKYGETALMLSSSYREIQEMLIKAGAFGAIARVNEDLIKAARRGDLPEVKRLIAKGADVNGKNIYGNRLDERLL
jgi:hypothetical protein